MALEAFRNEGTLTAAVAKTKRSPRRVLKLLMEAPAGANLLRAHEERVLQFLEVLAASGNVDAIAVLAARGLEQSSLRAKIKEILKLGTDAEIACALRAIR
jgi:hypothetical protein